MGAYITIIILLVLLTIYLIDKNSLQKALKDRVAWCVTADDNEKRYGLTLLEYLNNVKAELKYKIVDEEETSISEYILKQYQSELLQSYFNEQIKQSRKEIEPKYHSQGQGYFFITLSDFLSKHECESRFYDKEMYNTKSYKSYGTWGVPLFDATYELTDFAVVYHKMYYLAQLFCESHGLSSHSETERIKNCLESKEIKVSRI